MITLGNIKIEAVKGDISEQGDIEAIVNAANSQLQMGEGVSGAIHMAAGPDLADECISLAPIRTGEAVITDAYDLPNRYIIHTLGPVYGFNSQESDLLKASYFNSLQLAEDHQIKSIAFPALSTGIFGYPFEEATKIAIQAIKDYYPKLNSLNLIRFVLFTDKDHQIYKEEMLKELS